MALDPAGRTLRADSIWLTRRADSSCPSTLRSGPMGKGRFVRAYLDAVDSIEGGFETDAAFLFMAYNQLIAAEGISGDVLEIGVYQGKSALVVASLRGAGRRFFVVDLFEGGSNLSGATPQSQAGFMATMKRFYRSTDFIRPIAGASAAVQASDLGTDFSFCHIDGGHSPEETYRDLELCCQILSPGGLLALDDYFNPLTPGVCEGAVAFKHDHREALQPLAIGGNKVLFQKPGAGSDLNDRFSSAFPFMPKNTTTLWDQLVFLFDYELRPFVDLERSTLARLLPAAQFVVGACIQAEVDSVQAKPGQMIGVPVQVTNASSIEFHWGIFLSYHILAPDGSVVRWDNARSAFSPPLRPGERHLVNLAATAPNIVGTYLVEIDIVWEGITWFAERGSPTSTVMLNVA